MLSKLIQKIVTKHVEKHSDEIETALGNYVQDQNINKFKTIFAKFAKDKNIDDITMETKLAELKTSPLEDLEITVMLEQEFGINFPYDVYMNLKTIGDVYNYIEKKR